MNVLGPETTARARRDRASQDASGDEVVATLGSNLRTQEQHASLSDSRALTLVLYIQTRPCMCQLATRKLPLALYLYGILLISAGFTFVTPTEKHCQGVLHVRSACTVKCTEPADTLDL
jgi:hypothetical protein